MPLNVIVGTEYDLRILVLSLAERLFLGRLEEPGLRPGEFRELQLLEDLKKQWGELKAPRRKYDVFPQPIQTKVQLRLDGNGWPIL